MSTKHFTGRTLALIGLAWTIWPHDAQAQGRLYVAPNGSNEAAGTPASPFATVERAQQAAEGKTAGSVTVLIQGGTYRLTQPLAFTAADSGERGWPTTYAAYPGEHPVFTGDRTIVPQWRTYKGRILNVFYLRNSLPPPNTFTDPARYAIG